MRTLGGHFLEPRPHFNEKSTRQKKKRNWGGEEGKKRNFGAVQERAVQKSTTHMWNQHPHTHTLKQTPTHTLKQTPTHTPKPRTPKPSPPSADTRVVSVAQGTHRHVGRDPSLPTTTTSRCLCSQVDFRVNSCTDSGCRHVVAC